MQAKVINVPQGVTLGQVINPVVDTGFIDYVRNKFEYAANALQGINDAFIQSTMNLFNYFTSNEYINMGKQIILEGGERNEHVIHPVDINTIHQAGMTMAGYIMSNPVLWNMYQKFMISGFDDRFIVSDPTLPAEERLEYKQVMDGIMNVKEDGWEVKFYCLDENEKLTSMEKITVLDAWDDAMFLIEQGIDPTDPNKKPL